MLQRIQTLFLGIMVLALLGFVFVPIWSKASAEGNISIILDSFALSKVENGVVVQSVSTILLFSLAIGAAGLGLYSILSFQNRMRQMMLGMINSIVVAALLGAIIYYSFEGDKWLENSQKGSFGIGLLIPTVALILNTIANKFIRKDEEAVQASNRMR